MRHIIIYYRISLLLALFVVLPSFSQKRTSARQTNRTTHTAKQTSRNRTAASSKKQKHAVTYSNASIRKLQSQRAEIQKKIKEQEKALQENKANVSKKLNELMMINGDIDKNQQNIHSIEKDIHQIGRAHV